MPGDQQPVDLQAVQRRRAGGIAGRPIRDETEQRIRGLIGELRIAAQTDSRLDEDRTGRHAPYLSPVVVPTASELREREPPARGAPESQTEDLDGDGMNMAVSHSSS
ncbi:hypothetical protein [Streptomyces silvisoli]|uniref:Uncharacterized protein n=1 Tax=Streptomyces silvisoli TaxID=3034235 RepID=A0ABT5ZWG4_9ACTN|nr:hypothetical protein [Streptomyces silvisoli]MDF3294168.1 hypothetical protein [Streptomyces silvisoli]